MQEQRDAASEAHYTTLKVAYGDLDADVEEMNAWRKRKLAAKSDLSVLNQHFGKSLLCKSIMSLRD